MTYRERREAKAEKLVEWAEKRDAKADAGWERAHTMADAIPFGQPILVGHHSETRDRNYRARIASTMDRALADSRKADEMGRRSAGIKSQLEGSIYDDDPDAIEQLTARIATLEAERDRVKAYNASCRKGTRDLSLLDDRQRALIVRIAEVQAHALRGNGAFPSYHLSNLSGNIKRNRDRLAGLRTRAARAERTEAAGGQLVEVSGQGIGRHARVTFAEKPAREVLDELKAAGFTWSKGSWVGPADQLPACVTQ